MVAHIYNPSYLNGRDRRIANPRPAKAKLADIISLKQNTEKKRLRAWLEKRSTS
jgi:hypothetical protein